MKHLIFFITFLLPLHLLVFAQDSENKHLFNFYLGVQTRVTPIYAKRIPDFISVPDRNIFEQPNRYLSGPSILYRIERLINSSFDISFSHALRYDFLYTTFPFNSQPFIGFKQIVKRSFISDLYIDAEKKLPLKTSTFKVGIGLAVLGLGSGYILTQRFTDYNNQSIYISSKEDFVFTAVTATFGWQKNRLNASLKMGYAWYDPTWYKTPFLFPELKIQYNLFSF